MDGIEFTGTATPRSLWELSEAELAESCRHIAEGSGGGVLRAEALRLFLVWTEALNDRGRTQDERERRAALLSGLRKRTIQILVRLTMRN